MSRPILQSAVAESTVDSTPSAPTPAIGEWARFSFHSIGISLAGALALLIPWFLPNGWIMTWKPFPIAATTIILWIAFSALLAKCVKWPTELSLKWRFALAVDLLVSGAISFWIALSLPWSRLAHLDWVCDPIQVTGALLISSLAVFAWYEWLQTRPSWQRWLQTCPIWPATSWKTWCVRKIKVRPHEVQTRTATMDLMVAVALVWIFCPIWIVAGACFITAWADPFARVVGKSRKDWKKLPWGKKTYAGFTACMVTATSIAVIMLAFFTQLTGAALFGAAIFTGLVTALVELIPQWPEKPQPGQIISPADNFVLILGSAFALSLVA